MTDQGVVALDFRHNPSGTSMIKSLPVGRYKHRVVVIVHEMVAETEIAPDQLTTTSVRETANRLIDELLHRAESLQGVPQT